jgi:hypothetical protein
MVSAPSALSAITLNNEDKILSIYTEDKNLITDIKKPHVIKLTAFLDQRYTGVERKTE